MVAKKKLYVARDWRGLKNMITPDGATGNLDSPRNEIEKADTDYIKGDEEWAYLHYTRFVKAASALAEKNRLDKDLFNDLVRAVARCERLTASLKQRYEQLEREPPSGPNTPDPGTPKAFVTVAELRAALQKGDALVIDVRPRDAFVKSRIGISSNIINVPDIRKSITAHDIKNSLPAEAKKLFGRRKEFQKIVIVDWDGQDPSQSATTPYFVSEALKKSFAPKDAVTCQYLKSGYKQWTKAFQQDVTGPVLDSELNSSENGENGGKTCLLETFDRELKIKVSPAVLDPSKSTSTSEFSNIDRNSRIEVGQFTINVNKRFSAQRGQDSSWLSKPADDIFEVIDVYGHGSQWSRFHREAEKVHRSDNRSEGTGSPAKVSGLVNLGNTCYMNSVIQALAHSTEFARYFVEGRHQGHIRDQTRATLANSFADLLSKLWLGGNTHEAVTAFHKAVKSRWSDFDNFQQHDSQEFLTMLFSELEDNLNIPNPQGPYPQNDCFTSDQFDQKLTEFVEAHGRYQRSVVTENFEGILVSGFTCNKCKKESNRFEVFKGLSVPFPEPFVCSLVNCIDLFFNDEIIDRSCPRLLCEGERATKKTRIARLPKYLIIHLVRFRQDNPGQLGKITQSLDFAENLGPEDFQAFAYGDAVELHRYSLHGIVEHIGENTASGHYIARCRFPEKPWHKYNDDSVKAEGIEKSSRHSYLLFYSRVQGG